MKYNFKCQYLLGLLFVWIGYSCSAQGSGQESQGFQPFRDLLEVNSIPTPARDSLLAIINVTLIDGRGGDPVSDAIVLVDGTRILAVGAKEEIEIPPNTIIFDGQGKTLVPGLIDAHLHSINNDEFLNVILRNGTTTLRDPGHPMRFYQVLDFAKKVVPRVFLTGAHLDGYPGVHKSQAMLIKSASHARSTIQEYVSEGSSGIKIYFRLPLAYYPTVVHTANAAGIPVMAHLELVDADEAIRSGIHGIEHVTSFGTVTADPVEAKSFKDKVRENSGARSEGRYDLWSRIDLQSDRVHRVLDLARERNIYFCPTLTTFERQAGDTRAKEHEVRAFQNMLEFVGMAYRAGVKIVTGSHTSGWYADYGLAYQREMELLVEAGMTPMDVIQSSTLLNAQYFGSENRMGTIEKGKLADLILIEGNPLENISHMYKISAVMLNGGWIDRP